MNANYQNRTEQIPVLSAEELFANSQINYQRFPRKDLGLNAGDAPDLSISGGKKLVMVETNIGKDYVNKDNQGYLLEEAKTGNIIGRQLKQENQK